MVDLDGRANDHWVRLHAMHMSNPEVIHLIFCLVKATELYPEQDTTNESNDSHGSVVPDQ